MPIKQKFNIQIYNKDKINQISSIITDFGKIISRSSSVMFSTKIQINPDEIVYDSIIFQLESESEKSLDELLNKLCEDIDDLNAIYVLKNFETKEVIVYPNKFLGKIIVRFDNLKTIKHGTFDKLDKLKGLKTSCGYCRGVNPLFRPIETMSVEHMEVSPEIIYLVSNSSGNLEKLREYVFDEVRKTDSNIDVEFAGIVLK